MSMRPSVSSVLLLLSALVYLDSLQRNGMLVYESTSYVVDDTPTIPDPKTPEWNDSKKTSTLSSSSWPGQPAASVGTTPGLKLLRIGDDEDAPTHNARRFLLEHLDEFLEVYKNRPDQFNTCGMRINHALAVYTVTKRLQPTSIIESGINSGQSTYFFRKAAPNARIISMDPLDIPICGQPVRWMDATNNEYLTGKNFVDFNAMNWKERIQKKELDPSTTLAFIDDHQGLFKRFPTLVQYGFRHVMTDDNYKAGEGATPGDRGYFGPKQMYTRPDSKDTIWLFHNLKRYAEFPPLVAPVNTSNPKKVQGGFLHHTDDLAFLEEPLLRPDTNASDAKILERICSDLGIHPDQHDPKSNQELAGYCYIAYMELVPLSPYLAAAWRLK